MILTPEEAGIYWNGCWFERQVLEGKQIAEAKKLEEMKVRNKAREEAIRNKPVGFHPTKNIDFNCLKPKKPEGNGG